MDRRGTQAVPRLVWAVHDCDQAACCCRACYARWPVWDGAEISATVEPTSCNRRILRQEFGDWVEGQQRSPLTSASPRWEPCLAQGAEGRCLRDELPSPEGAHSDQHWCQHWAGKDPSQALRGQPTARRWGVFKVLRLQRGHSDFWPDDQGAHEGASSPLQSAHFHHTMTAHKSCARDTCEHTRLQSHAFTVMT